MKYESKIIAAIAKIIVEVRIATFPCHERLPAIPNAKPKRANIKVTTLAQNLISGGIASPSEGTLSKITIAKLAEEKRNAKLPAGSRLSDVVGVFCGDGGGGHTSLELLMRLILRRVYGMSISNNSHEPMTSSEP